MTAVAATWDEGFREPSTLAPSVATGNAEFSARIMTSALRPVFVRPQEDAATGEVRTVPAVRGGWRPRLSALSKEASARMDGQLSPQTAEPAGPQLLGSLPGDHPEEETTAEDVVDDEPLADDQVNPLEGLSGDALDDAIDAQHRPQKPAEVDQQELAQTGPAEPLRVATRTPAQQSPDNPDEDDAPQAIQNERSARVPPLSRSQQALRDKVRRVLKYYYDHPLHTGNRGPWEVMHQMLAFEVHSHIRQHSANGEPITAVGWLCFNQPCRGRDLLHINNDGELRVRVGPALQGHEGQLLALLAQARVKSTYPIRVEGKEFTIADLVDVEKKTCYPRTELTFKLLGLQNYLDIDDRWVNDQGMQWDFATLVREEMRQPVRTAACGGTHRLSGLTFAYKKYQKTGRPLTGEFAAAKRFVGNYQNYAYRLQNSDGSFSTEWFRGPGHETDIDRRLKTTGHTLEWLLYAAEEKHFTYNRTVRAVNYLANIMWTNRTRDWEAGPLGHAIHALVLYDRLYFQQFDEANGDSVASGPGSSRR
ncbi:MAG: hypothetical protein KDA44_19165 [Planctomycetales bacterium]|nr:hypothetical protein [Planctomycetales bacterium]